MVKINTVKKMNLIELINWAFENEITASLILLTTKMEMCQKLLSMYVEYRDFHGK